MPLPSPFEKWTFDQAAKLLALSIVEDRRYKQLSRFLDAEDYWQNATQYRGPMPAPEDAEGFEYLARSFVALPKLGEMLRRHVRGVSGREPAFEVVLQEEQSLEGAQPDEAAQARLQAEKDAIDDAQSAWWDARRLHEVVQEFTLQLRGYGRACLRYDVPPDLLTPAQDAAGNLTQAASVGTWQDALEMIYVEVPALGSARVYTDPRSMRQCGIFRYFEDAPSALDVTTRQATQTRRVECIQLSYLSSDAVAPKTIVRTLRRYDSSATNETSDLYELDCGGHLLVAESRMKPLLTDAMVELNNKLNTVCTMIKINADVAGFPKMIAIDLAQPTIKVNGKDVPAPLFNTPRKAPFLVSLVDDSTNADDEPVRTPRSGTMLFREPVSSEPLRKDALFFEEQMYSNAQQRHVGITGDATSSGIARVEARSDYADSLLETKPHVEGPLRVALMGPLCWAAHLAQDATQLKRFCAARMRVDCNLNAGPLSADERREIEERYVKGLIGRESAMVMLGTEDVTSEVQNIDSDPIGTLDVEIKRATLFGVWAQTFPFDVAAKLAGVDEAKIKTMTAAPTAGFPALPNGQ